MEINNLIKIVGTDCDLAEIKEDDIDLMADIWELQGDPCTGEEIQAAKDELLELNGTI